MYLLVFHVHVCTYMSNGHYFYIAIVLEGIKIFYPARLTKWIDPAGQSDRIEYIFKAALSCFCF